MMRHLISAGANTNSAWYVAIQEGKLLILDHFAETRLAELEEDEDLRLDVLDIATKQENPGILWSLLALGVFNALEMGQCLCIAVQMQNIEVMKLLVSFRADVDAYNWCGEAPMGHAIRGGKVDAFKLLLSLGANVSIPANNAQYSAIHTLAIRGGCDLLKAVYQVCNTRGVSRS